MATRILSKLPPIPQGARYLPLPSIARTGGIQTIRDVSPSLWFSPLIPIKPVAPADLRVRRYQYPPGANIMWQPGVEEGGGVGFEILRSVADSYYLFRIALETVKDRLAALPWEIRPKTKEGESKADYQARSQKDTRIQAVTKFLERPDGEHDYKTWMRMILEDMLVLDAPAVYLQRDTKNRIASLQAIDGATICRYLTDQGFTPSPPNVAYAQVLYGLPSIDLTTDDLVYAPRNPRTNRRYGLGVAEQILIIIAIGLQKTDFLSKYFTSGNIPEALCFLPPTMPIDKVAEVQDWFDTMLAGDLAKRRRLTFLPGYGTDKDARPNIIFPKEVLLKDDLDNYIWQVVAYAIGTTPSGLMKMVNRASGQQFAETAEEEGLQPKAVWMEDFVNNIIQNKMGYADLEYARPPREEVDPEKQMLVSTGYAKSGVLTINEVRKDLGKDPFPYAEADEPGVLTQNGFMPLTAGMAEKGGGSQEGPAGAILGQNMEEKKQDDREYQQQQMQAKQKQIAAVPHPAPGKQPPPKQKKAIWAHCDDHESCTPSCAKCVDLELERVSKVYSERKAEDEQKAHCPDHAVHDLACFDCAHAELNSLEKRLNLAQKKLTINPAHSTPDVMAARSKLQRALLEVLRRQRDKAKDAAERLLKDELPVA